MDAVLLPIQRTVHGVRHWKATLLNAPWISTGREQSPWKYRWCYYAINKRQINVTISICAHAHTFKRKGGDSVGGKDNATITQHNSMHQRTSGEANGPASVFISCTNYMHLQYLLKQSLHMFRHNNVTFREYIQSLKPSIVN